MNLLQSVNISNKYITLIAGFTLFGVVGYKLHNRQDKKPLNIENDDKQIYVDLSLLQSSKNMEYESKPPGLINSKNHCFVNSVLQALAAQSSFVEYLFQLVHYFRGEKSLDQAITIELAYLMKDLNSDGECHDPMNLISLLEQDRDYSFFQQQQDCYELFNLLMNHIEKAQKQIQQHDLAHMNKKPCNLINPFLMYQRTQITCLRCHKKYSIRLETNYAQHLILTPTLENSIIYSEKPECIQDYKCISCSLKKLKLITKSPIVDDYLSQNHFEEEPEEIIKQCAQQCNYNGPLSNIIQRSSVNKYSKTSGQQSIKCYFIKRITMNHFGDLVKASDPIQLPQQIAYYGRQYKLTAVICHIGNTSDYGTYITQQGHYVTLRRSLQLNIESSYGQSEYRLGQWYLISDTVVRQAKLPEECEAYMVFYDQI